MEGQWDALYPFFFVKYNPMDKEVIACSTFHTTTQGNTMILHKVIVILASRLGKE